MQMCLLSALETPAPTCFWYCVHMCIWRPEVSFQRCGSSGATYLIFLRHDFLMVPSSPVKLG